MSEEENGDNGSEESSEDGSSVTSDVLVKAGATCEEGVEYFCLLSPSMNGKKGNWPFLRAVLADAERRAGK